MFTEPSMGCGRSVFFIAPLLFACATTSTAKKSEETELREECRDNLSKDPRCIELLTKSPDDLEAKEEVMRAEAQREDDAFSDRISRLRRERDAKTSSRAVGQIGDLEEGDEDVGDEIETGSSVRALKAEAPPKPMPKIEEPVAIAPDPAPEITPETYLRGSVCLIDGSIVAMKRAMNLSQGAKTARAELALAIVEADTLGGQVRQEMDHRGLSRSTDPNCTTRAHAEMVEVLRSLLGPTPKPGESAEWFGRGLVRLRKELETRAGLPKAAVE
jgi:hypothetical protein